MTVHSDKFIIAIEGMDGAGKTTLANYLHSLIPNSEVIHFPSEDVKKLIKENDLSFEDKVSNLIEDMIRTLQEAKSNVLILDRYWLSTLIYQYKCEEDEKFFCTVRENLPVPDIFVGLNLNKNYYNRSDPEQDIINMDQKNQTLIFQAYACLPQYYKYLPTLGKKILFLNLPEGVYEEN